jgi:hypothetical protein
MGISPNQYLMDWFFTVFSRTVPLELSSMLWDHFLSEHRTHQPQSIAT